MPCILVVEDQRKLLNSLRRVLEQQGYQVLTAETGDVGLEIALREPIEAVILDLMLPGTDGMQVIAELRRQGFHRPIMILTARDAVEDRVAGLEQGADDYLVKPFALPELVARLRALLRRDAVSREPMLRAGHLQLDILRRSVYVGEELIDLSNREFEVLEYLVRHRNQTVTRDMINRDVWKEPAGVLTNVIDVYIKQLRKKIERPGQPARIQTVRGVGYALRDTP